MGTDIGQDSRVIAAFSRRKMLHRVLTYLAYIPVIFALYVRWNPDLTMGGLTWGPIFGLALGLGIILMFSAYLFWRCPACNKFIGFRRHPVACTHCKANFVKNP